MKYFCCDMRRLEVIKLIGKANGIEYLEVRDHLDPEPALRQRTLFVRLLRRGFKLTPDNVLIDGGERRPTIAVEWVASANSLPAGTDASLVEGIDDPATMLVIRTTEFGDFSRYTLHLRAKPGSDGPPEGFDPKLSDIDFSFKAECPSDFDCAATPACPPQPVTTPDIDYLAKDYTGFRRLMLDRLNLLAPGWAERSAADLGVALVEVLAYAADNLSYRQDAIANEAYLSTARKRVSVRRHARLVDYALHDGCNARAWVHLEVHGNDVLPRGTPMFTKVGGLPVQIDPDSKEWRGALASGTTVFETAHDAHVFEDLNTLSFYTWGDAACCLPRGATHATLRGECPGLKAGDVLVLQEIKSPTTFTLDDADRSKCWAVRLTTVVTSVDPSGQLFDEPPQDGPIGVTEIAWGAADALPFPLCLSVKECPGVDISVALGNIVLVDHGQTVRGEPLGTVPEPRLRRVPAAAGAQACQRAEAEPIPVRFRPALANAPLTQGFDLAAELGVPLTEDERWWPASALIARDPHDALPFVKLLGQPGSGDWTPQRDLFSSGSDALEFVVETENDGVALLRFGDDVHGQRPNPGTRFTATYRIGNGSAGNVGAGSIAHIVTSQKKLFAAVSNPLPAAGGVDPEDIESARRDAPEAFRTQERAVTTADYAAAAERRADVQRAAATFRWTGSWHTVFVTADRFGGGAVDARFEARLRRHLERFRMAGYDLEVDAPRFVALDIALHICVLPGYFRSEVLRAVAARLGSGVLPDGSLGVFHPDNSSFGDPVYSSRIVAAAQVVTGVEAVWVQKFKRMAEPDTAALENGVIPIGRLEIAQLANNPNFRDRGRLTLHAGGRQMNNTVIVPGTESCGCCEGIDASTPQGIDNRIGLAAITYRIGEYAHFKESMLAGLSSPRFTQLRDKLRTRDADDYTLALIDAVACAADVLTFYQERLANESYLRTATERVSLQEMAKLIGYRLRPGIAAETWLAFALETPRPAPANLPPEPGAFVTGIPTSLTLAPGLKVQSVPGPDEKPQTFETVEEIVARPEWNFIRPWLSEPASIDEFATETWLQGLRNDLGAGDALVFGGSEFLNAPESKPGWDFRLIELVELDVANGCTRVQWRQGLREVTPQSYLHLLRKRMGVFGRNAPIWTSLNLSFRTMYAHNDLDVAARDEWPDFTISPNPADDLAGGDVDLDSTLRNAGTERLAILAKVDSGAPTGIDYELFSITASQEVPRAAFGIAGKVTRLTLAGRGLKKYFEKVRETSVYAQSEVISLATYPVLTDDVSGDQLPLAISADGLQPGRRLLIIGTQAVGSTRRVHQASIIEAKSSPNGVTLTIAPPLPAALKRETVIVYANVALATHGETVSQILGAGDASRTFQRFELNRLPLTYRSAASELGADSELSVRIGDVEWAEKPTLFGGAPTERAYALGVDEQGKSFVVFGDGVRGARLPSGVNNVRAKYRQGSGREGNVDSDKLTQLMTRPLGLKSVSNPAAAQGGADPEAASQARRTMPMGTRTLGRAVSLVDYEDFALACVGIAKAQARLLQLPGGPTIAITVAGQEGAAPTSGSPVWNKLWQALKSSGDPHVSVVLLPYQASTFSVGLKVKRDPASDLEPVLAAVEAALRLHYSFDARSLAQPVLQSEIIAVVHAVPGVVAVDLDFLFGGTAPPAQTAQSRQTRLLASTMRASGGMALPAELLTLDAAPFYRLEEMR